MRAAWTERLRSAREVVRYDAGRACFVETASGQALAGITTHLRACFYPHAATGAHGRSSRSGQRPAQLTGRARGRLVDRELAAAVNEGAEPSHAYTRALLSALRRAGLTPLAAQVPVCDPSTRMATGVDLVCERRGALYVMELKTGWNGRESYERAGRAMRGAAAPFPDCPRNQHLLQLLVTRYLFRLTFGLQSAHAAVVRVSDDGVRFYKLPSSFLDREAAVVRELASRIYASRAEARRSR